MNDATDDTPLLSAKNQLRWEIAVAMLIKILLLIGLWWLIFRWPGHQTGKPDIAEHFALSAQVTDFSSQSNPEVHHVR